MTSNLVKRFERNTKGRDLIVPDIHGHFSKVRAALAEVGYSPENGDRLFSVGDLVDRGPESLEALEFLKTAEAVSGNHEAMAVMWAQDGSRMDSGNYAANGGGWFMALDRETQKEIAATFQSLPVAIEIDTEGGLVGIVHAECPFDEWSLFTGALEHLDGRDLDQLIDFAQWSRNKISAMEDSIVSGVRAVVVGHTPMARMTSLGNTLYIDTMGWRGQQFTILDAATLQPARKP